MLRLHIKPGSNLNLNKRSKILLCFIVLLLIVTGTVFQRDEKFSIIRQAQIDCSCISLQTTQTGVAVSPLAEKDNESSVEQLSLLFQASPPAEKYIFSLLEQDKTLLGIGYSTVEYQDKKTAFSVSVDRCLTLITVVCTDATVLENGETVYDIYTYGYWTNISEKDKTESPAPTADLVLQYLGFAGLVGIEDHFDAYYADDIVGTEGDDFWRSHSYGWSIFEDNHAGLQSFSFHTRAVGMSTGEEHTIYSAYVHSWKKNGHSTYLSDVITDENSETFQIVPGDDKTWVLYNKVSFIF